MLLKQYKDIRKLVSNFKFAKCPQCGSTGIHACAGKTVQKVVDMSQYSKYSTLEEAIDHIRRSEAEQRLKKREERKNGRNGSSC